MPFVLDASVALCWAFPVENNPRAALALEKIRMDEAVVPGLLWFDVRNALVTNERRKWLAEDDTARFLRLLGRLRMRIDRIPNEDQVLRLARTHGLTVYDAAYLELAEREGIALATMDAALAKAARAESVPLV